MGQLLSESEIEVFRHLLSDYRPDFSILETFLSSNFVVLAGPAGAGKDTLRNALVEKKPEIYAPIISTTTRPVRVGELDGREYHFGSNDEIKAGLLAKQFFQARLVHNQQVSCLHAGEIRKLGSGQIGLSILVVQQEEDLQMLKSDLKTIFLVPPSLEILKSRMQADRGFEPDEFDRRLAAAKTELHFALNRPHYYCLISDDIGTLTHEADRFLRTGQWDKTVDYQARSRIDQILSELL